jgi:S-methyl-1-thioxylulose 5-phosphate methylthiotransferase
MPTHLLSFDPSAFRWSGIGRREYKSGSGDRRGMGWKGVSRWLLASSEAIPADYELRYFEIEPAGYSSLEKHRHVHFVVVLRGHGRALVGEQMLDLCPFDALHVPPLTPHRWVNEGAEPFGFLCPVDRERDRPQPIDDAEWDALRANPVTARYVF